MNTLTIEQLYIALEIGILIMLVVNIIFIIKNDMKIKQLIELFKNFNRKGLSSSQKIEEK